MAQAQVTTTTVNGDTVLSVTPNDSKTIRLNTNNTYVDRDIVVNIEGKCNYFPIPESIVTVATSSTKGTAPLNTSYGTTDITISADSTVEWIEGAAYAFIVNTTMVAASATRNVRVRIGTSGAWIPVLDSSGAALGGSSYFLKNQTRVLIYKTTYQSTGALHMITDSNSDTTYLLRNYLPYTAGEALTAGWLAVDVNNTLKKLIGGIAFNYDKGVYYVGSNIASGSTGNNNYQQYYNIANIATNHTSFTNGAVGKPLYLSGSIDGNTFTVDSSNYLTVAPATANKVYMFLGVLYSATNLNLMPWHPLFVYKDNKLKTCAQTMLDAPADTKVTNTLATTTKTYLTGTATATTNTGTQNFDTGVYLTTTAGQVNATTYKVNEGAVIAYNATTGCLEVTT